MPDHKAPATEVITYSLRGGKTGSPGYYQAVARFADEVILDGERRVGSLVDGWLAYLADTGCEPPRSRPEYLFELLVLGILWGVYREYALALSANLARLLAWLSDLRERSPRLKKAADIARGLFAARLRPARSSSPTGQPLASVEDVQRLLSWMRAAGRFHQEVKRLEAWRDFFSCQPNDSIHQELSRISGYAAWFAARSLETLGEYTPQVERFLADIQPSYRWREDYIFCGRQRVEYHLNMVGTEILNRSLRAEFNRTHKRVVLVPPCMRALPDDLCKAVSTPLGARCMACTPGCRVHQLSKLGEKHGFSVFTLPDDLRVFTGGSLRQSGSEQVGIVGVSCVLTNIQGGWDVRDLGIPAQGLLLDYCGCSYHWHQQGIATDINFQQLLRLLKPDT